MTGDSPAPRADFAIWQAMSSQTLLPFAVAEGLQPKPNQDRVELLAALLEQRLAAGGTVHAEGVLDVLPEGFAFLRTRQLAYAVDPADVYVSPSQVRAFDLRAGHRLSGPVRPPKRGERYFALVSIDRVNGEPAENWRSVLPFGSRTPLLPTERLRLGHEHAAIDLRAIDLLAPWGKGQRVLLTAPPAWPRTDLLARIATALAHNHRELQLVVCLLDQRPEDTTAARRALANVARCEVLATTFDEPPARHVALAEIVAAACQREVEADRDVVLLIDSLTALARACHLVNPPSGRLLCAGLDASATQRGKRLFASARACEEGGSLTVIATALAGTDSPIDAAIAAEFQHRGNSEVVVDPALAAAGVEPPLDVQRTATRCFDEIGPRAEVAARARWRQELAALPPAERLARVLAALPVHGQ
ncbi:MAG TPA: transcription termination factor Rho [Planctomycetota bacterium]